MSCRERVRVVPLDFEVRFGGAKGVAFADSRLRGARRRYSIAMALCTDIID